VATFLLIVALCALASWVTVLLLPWRPYALRERLEADSTAADGTLADVTVLIPARDEADVIGRTLHALARQAASVDAIVVDDQSRDGTAEAAIAAAGSAANLTLTVLPGRPLPDGWAGKLWALEQGLARVERRFVLLLDADIELAPGIVTALRRLAVERDAALVSVMAELECESFVERLLTPAFIFFFKLLYPFALANDRASRVAAAAGGCMLVRTEDLRALGGFAAIRGALIDDCTLAARLKSRGAGVWIGVSHSVRSVRGYSFADFWRMVSRSAFTQLRYSPALLLFATVLMSITLLAPPLLTLGGAAFGAAFIAAIGAAAWLALGAAYLPVVRFYRLAPAWALALPLAGALYLAMTWSSACNYWRGTRATWKNRRYDSSV
jgi:hopene-associated glycosyltransferase HpnB